MSFEGVLLFVYHCSSWNIYLSCISIHLESRGLLTFKEVDAAHFQMITLLHFFAAGLCVPRLFCFPYLCQLTEEQRHNKDNWYTRNWSKGEYTLYSNTEATSVVSLYTLLTSFSFLVHLGMEPQEPLMCVVEWLVYRGDPAPCPCKRLLPNNQGLLAKK